MEESLESSLTELIDYAGLFPPAKLSMDSSFAEYSKHVEGPEAMLVRSFVCPASHLMELAALIERKPVEAAIPISVIGGGGESQAAWEYALEHDARFMESFAAEAGDSAELIGYEVKLPHTDRLQQCIADLKPFNSLEVYLEAPWDDALPDNLVAIAESAWVYAKARTGGVEAAAFPSAADLAGFIQSACQLDLSYKLTAGLHHPFPTTDAALKVEMHGFVNALAATVFAQKFDLTKKEIEAVLTERDSSRFKFDGDGLRLGELEASLEDIENGRDLFQSFGSCSISEPWRDLVSAGTLGRGDA